MHYTIKLSLPSAMSVVSSAPPPTYSGRVRKNFMNNPRECVCVNSTITFQYLCCANSSPLLLLLLLVCLTVQQIVILPPYGLMSVDSV